MDALLKTNSIDGKIKNIDFLKAAEVFNTIYYFFINDAITEKKGLGNEIITVERIHENVCLGYEKFPDKYPQISKDEIHDILNCFAMWV